MTVATKATGGGDDVATASRGEAAARREGQGRNKSAEEVAKPSSPETRSIASPSAAGAAGASGSRASSSQYSQNRGARMRARLGSGELLLQETPDGLVMSPALHRHRMLTGLTTLKSAEEMSPMPLLGEDRREGGGSKTRFYDAVKGGGDGGGGGRGVGSGGGRDGYEVLASRAPRDRSGNGNGSGGGWVGRQRSSTWDEHGVKAQLAKRAVERTSGPPLPPHPLRRRCNALVSSRTRKAMGSMYQQELYHEKSDGIVDVLVDRTQVPVLIILVGIMAAFAGMIVSYCSDSAKMWRIVWTTAHPNMPFLCIAYGASSLCITLCMCAITHYICPCASGGGVPEMKAVLSGASRPGLLSARLVLVKAMGVIAANAAGLSVGKEGPLIHITCAMADVLMATPTFKQVRLNNSKRLEILACACAAGVAATFGSVFGGTLFSVEVTATAYMVQTLPATFLTAVVVAVVFWASGRSELFTLFSDNTAQAKFFTGADLAAWSVLGALCGLVGAGFVAVLDGLSRRRNFFTRKDLGESTRKMRMFGVVALCTLMVIPASYTEAVAFIEYESRDGKHRLHPLVDQMYEQRVFGVSWKMLQLLLLKAWATVFSVVQPLPVGLFSPVFVIGGVMGRNFGELARWVDQYVDAVNINFQPWEFALIGSAAFAAGVTRAVSTAVIVFELSGQNHLRLPLGVALMISYFIANRFTKGVYDALMDTNGTPHLEEVPPEDRNVPAEDVMIHVEDIPCLSLYSTGKDASEVAALCQPGQVIPVVQSMSDKVLVGVVLWNDLAIALADYRTRGSITTNTSMLETSTTPTRTAPSSHGSGSGGDGIRRRGIKDRRNRVMGSPNVAAAAAAATGKAIDDPLVRRGGGRGTGSSVLARSESGIGSTWPRLAAVAEKIGKRVKWFPKIRTAEASLLQQLDFERTEEGDEENERGDPASPLSPLGPGIPYPSYPPDPTTGFAEGSEGVIVGESASLLGAGGDGSSGNGGSSRGLLSSARRYGGTSTTQRSVSFGPRREVRGMGDVSGAGGGRGDLRRRPWSASASSTAAAAVARTAKERADRAPLRFYLVREGHKFVAVGRTRRKGAWTELAAVPSYYGIPVVLDPSPYQVTHTTELSKVDIAFRLLKLDHAFVCNAGRLVGVITRDSLVDFMSLREVTPMDECMSLFGALSCCVPRRRVSGAIIDSDDDGGYNSINNSDNSNTYHSINTTNNKNNHSDSSSNTIYSKVRGEQLTTISSSLPAEPTTSMVDDALVGKGHRQNDDATGNDSLRLRHTTTTTAAAATVTAAMASSSTRDNSSPEGVASGEWDPV